MRRMEIMKERFRRFMIGRYGYDELSKYTLGFTILLMILSMFLDSTILYILSIALLIVIYLRTFSKNIQRRYTENQKFNLVRTKVTTLFLVRKKEFEQRKQYRFYRCPDCRQRVRVPRGKGKISITCPKCRGQFIRKS